MDQERKEFMRLLPPHPECYPALQRILDPSSASKEVLESAPVSPFQGGGAAGGRRKEGGGLESKTREELLEELIDKIMLLNAEEFDEFCKMLETLEASEEGAAAPAEMRPGA